MREEGRRAGEDEGRWQEGGVTSGETPRCCKPLLAELKKAPRVWRRVVDRCRHWRSFKAPISTLRVRAVSQRVFRSENSTRHTPSQSQCAMDWPRARLRRGTRGAGRVHSLVALRCWFRALACPLQARPSRTSRRIPQNASPWWCCIGGAQLCIRVTCAAPLAGRDPADLCEDQDHAKKPHHSDEIPRGRVCAAPGFGFGEP